MMESTDSVFLLFICTLVLVNYFLSISASDISALIEWLFSIAMGVRLFFLMSIF